ncbi:DUF6443 domain-containing protein [Maribacter sp. 2308TA10-17]|uniref:DUF6443 domain-containing protein n=1 Tax=Maribacter sp. 2308TA10-17 TaxID=3386276 RepID=UPI0039BC7438
MKKILSLQLLLIGLISNAQETPYTPPVPSDGNFILSRTYQEEKNSSNEIVLERDVIETIQYFDGLGRGQQTIGIGQSPTGADMVTPYEYDIYGRMLRDWLPFPSTQYDRGAYKPGSTLDAQQFYGTKYPNDFQNLATININAYSEKTVEASPLNRALKQGAPGKDWQITSTDDTDHAIGYSYLSNTHNPDNVSDPANDNVRLFTVTLSSSNNETTSLSSGTYYPAGELSKTITKDENHQEGQKNHTTEEFKDKTGRVILKRTYADVPAMDKNGDGDTNDAGEQAQNEAPHDTYYVYDDFGNLTYVMPPKMESATASLTELDNQMNALGYQYSYDFRNRLVAKKIPGKGIEYIVYNNLDLPILTQDAEQRKSNEWLFTKYDVHGRVAYTGKATIADDRPILQNTVTALPDTFTLWTTRTTGNTTNAIGGKAINYTPEGYPQNSITEVLTVNYYDDYDITTNDLGGSPTSTSVFGKATDNRTKGLPTVSLVKVLETDDWIKTVSLYDDKARAIYTHNTNDYLGTTDIIASELDFIGKTLKTKTAHTRNGTTIVTIDNFTYDHSGRLLAQTQCVGDQTLSDSCEAGGNGIDADIIVSGYINTDRIATNSMVVRPNATVVPNVVLRIDPNATGGGSGETELIVLNTYDELAQLEKKKVGGDADANNVLNSVGLQTVDYTYNVRSWLKSINNPNAMGDDLFAFGIKYNDVGDPNRRLYNGNISQTVWNSANNAIAGSSASRNYVYTYDALNRITGATGLPNSPHNVSNISYDKNGNIMTLNRMGHTQVDDSGLVTDYGLMDDLTYTYIGNQLKAVNDDNQASATQGFIDGSELTLEYTHDSNGNMKTDTNKDITSISYNHLNQPEVISISGGSITYVYDATGIKQKKIVSTGTVTEYAGNYIYENTGGGVKLQFFSIAEGYVEPKNFDDLNQGYDYIYQFQDHLGNIRLSYKDLSSNSTPNLEIQEENNYYPFGLKHKGYNFGRNGRNHKYGFGGKEEQEDNINGSSLDWLDFSARNYDATLGRWFVIDKMSDMAPQWSPYRYAFNNPIKYIDSDGNFELDANTAAKYPRLAEFLKNGIQDVINNPSIVNGLMKYGQLSKEDIKLGLTYGEGPKIIADGLNGAIGEFTPGTNSKEIKIDKDFLQALEDATGADADVYLLLIAVTILHEYVHYGDDQDGIDYPDEEGDLFEIDVYGEDIGDYDSAKKVFDQWQKTLAEKKKKQAAENKKKAEGLNNLINNIDNVEDGNYVWDGSNWVKE